MAFTFTRPLLAVTLAIAACGDDKGTTDATTTTTPDGTTVAASTTGNPTTGGTDTTHDPSAAQTTGDDEEARLYHAVVDKYRPGTDTSGYAYVGYQGVLGLVRATTGLGDDTSPAAVATAIRSAKNVVLPAGGGLTFTCDGTANPMLKSVCSKGSILAVMEDGKLVDGKVAPK